MAAGSQMGEKEADQVHDTEITLSTGKLLGIFFALAIVCAVFFTMGYLLGKSTSAGGRTEIVSTVPTGGNAAGKPFAGNKTPETTTQNCPPGSPNCAPTGASADTGSGGKNADQQASTQQSSSQQSSGNKAPDQSAGTEVKNGAGGSFMVQVAAVSKQEDADILVTALRKKQYPVFIANSAGDPLFHVQVGPYSEKKDAEAMRVRLAGDGYNAIVK